MEFLHPSAQKRKNTKMTKTDDFGNNFQFQGLEGKNYFLNRSFLEFLCFWRFPALNCMIS